MTTAKIEEQGLPTLKVDIVIGKVNLVGSITIPRDPVGGLEALATVIETFANEYGTPTKEVMSDLAKILGVKRGK